MRCADQMTMMGRRCPCQSPQVDVGGRLTVGANVCAVTCEGSESGRATVNPIEPSRVGHSDSLLVGQVLYP